jgi:D-alanyl-D-alanine carboxypeptidase
MSNSAADGVGWTSTLDGVVAETAASRLLPGVHRCLLRVETPHRPEGWTAAATTHPDDRDGLDTEVAFRIASVTKMMTATALLVLADQGHCRLEDPTGQYLPSQVVDRFRDHTGGPYAAAITLRQLLDHTSGLPNFFSQPPILEAVQHGAGRRRFTPCPGSSADVVSGTGSYVGSRASKITPGHLLRSRA